MIDKKKGKNSDPTWDRCEKVEEGKDSRLRLKCIHCGNYYWGGIFRIKNHLAGTRKDVGPCMKVSNDIRDFFKQLLDKNKKNKDGDDFFDNEEDEHG